MPSHATTTTCSSMFARSRLSFQGVIATASSNVSNALRPYLRTASPCNHRGIRINGEQTNETNSADDKDKDFDGTKLTIVDNASTASGDSVDVVEEASDQATVSRKDPVEQDDIDAIIDSTDTISEFSFSSCDDVGPWGRKRECRVHNPHPDYAFMQVDDYDLIDSVHTYSVEEAITEAVSLKQLQAFKLAGTATRYDSDSSEEQLELYRQARFTLLDEVQRLQDDVQSGFTSLDDAYLEGIILCYPVPL